MTGQSVLGSGTFTLNNYGVFGVDGSAAIINHPEVAILGVGRIMDKPWVVKGELAVRKVTELTSRAPVAGQPARLSCRIVFKE
jgi:2-oxoisovalerate dehydrogenase E2 component (dihydrolipoyl transacylase)